MLWRTITSQLSAFTSALLTYDNKAKLCVYASVCVLTCLHEFRVSAGSQKKKDLSGVKIRTRVEQELHTLTHTLSLMTGV